MTTTLFTDERRTVILTLPFPPYTNNLYATITIKGGPKKGTQVRIPSKESKVFKEQVARICKQQGIRPLAGEVAVNLRIYRPRRVGDIDGSFKATLDSLKTFAYADDAQVAELHAWRFNDKLNPRVEIEIREIRRDGLFQNQ
jgi:Holliday junction resolvase RusA-like endonuclease